MDETPSVFVHASRVPSPSPRKNSRSENNAQPLRAAASETHGLRVPVRSPSRCRAPEQPARSLLFPAGTSVFNLPTQSVELLVVGAGPVGLFGALCARERGIDVMVIDQSFCGLGRGYATLL